MGRMGNSMAAAVEMAVVVIQAGLGLTWDRCSYHPKYSETENGMTQTARKRRLGTRHDPFPVLNVRFSADRYTPYCLAHRSSGPPSAAAEPVTLDGRGCQTAKGT